MHLHDLMGWPGPMTRPQYLAWQEWLRQQWNEPDRGDHYLMQLASLLVDLPHAVWGKRPPAHKMDAFRLPFEWRQRAPEPGKPPPTQSELDTMKAMLVARMGGRVRGWTPPSTGKG